MEQLCVKSADRRGSQRNLPLWKETYIYMKRDQYMMCKIRRLSGIPKNPTYMEKDLYIWKETNTYEKRHNVNEKRPTQGTTYMKRDLFWLQLKSDGTTLCKLGRLSGIQQKSTYTKTDLCIWKETKTYEKKPMCMEQDLPRRATKMEWKETYSDCN